MIPATLDALKVPVAELRPYGRNPRRGNLEAIKASLEAHGQYRPVVVRRGTGEVLAGNHTLKAAQDLGWLEVAATYVDVDDDEAARIVLVDNRTNDLAGYDDTELAALLESLPDLGGTGYGAEDLDQLLASLNIDPDRDTAPAEPPADPVTQPGDLIVLGEHRLLCGDATSASDVATLLDGDTPALMLTDPPYGVSYDPDWRNRAFGEAGRSTGQVTNDDLADWREAWALFTGDVAYVWHAGSHAHVVAQSLEATGFAIRSQIIWAKQHFAISRGHYHVQHEPCWYAVRKGRNASWIGDRKQTTLWQANNGLSQGGGSDDAKTNHGAQKPVELTVHTLANHGGDVYEPFAGSGSTLIACENLGRRCYALEFDPGYCDVIVDRWERHTGQKAARVS